MTFMLVFSFFYFFFIYVFFVCFFGHNFSFSFYFIQVVQNNLGSKWWLFLYFCWFFGRRMEMKIDVTGEFIFFGGGHLLHEFSNVYMLYIYT